MSPHVATQIPSREVKNDIHRIAKLLRAVDPDLEIVTDASVLAEHSKDHAALAVTGRPACLARPTTTKQVQKIMRLATAERVPVVPQGTRTGLSGAAAAIDGSILLTLEAMDRIIDIDAANQTATVEPGVINKAISDAARPHGLFFPPDPGSWDIATIGGNAATDAGGFCCVKYGVTSDWVLALEIVLADGRVLTTGQSTAKGVAGYDLVHLFVGSEGTLGVITKLVLGLRPLAKKPRTAVGFFSSMSSACATVQEIMAGPATPSLLELIDPVSVAALRRHRDTRFPESANTVVILQTDEPGDSDRIIDDFMASARRNGAEASQMEDEEAANRIITARRAVGLVLELEGTTISEDVCVPRTRLVELVEGVAAISAHRGVSIACTGHAGDGNMHPTIVYDAGEPGLRESALAAFADVMELGLALGGTITGEHGVGTMKRDWLEHEIGPVGLDVHRAIKAALDPFDVLNPGKVFSILPDHEYR